jgi:hypothetical protein
MGSFSDPKLEIWSIMGGGSWKRGMDLERFLEDPGSVKRWAGVLASTGLTAEDMAEITAAADYARELIP